MKRMWEIDFRGGKGKKVTISVLSPTDLDITIITFVV